MKSNRFTLFVLVTFCLSLVLAACDTGPSAEEQTQVAQAGETEQAAAQQTAAAAQLTAAAAEKARKATDVAATLTAQPTSTSTDTPVPTFTPTSTETLVPSDTPTPEATSTETQVPGPTAPPITATRPAPASVELAGMTKSMPSAGGKGPSLERDRSSARIMRSMIQSRTHGPCLPPCRSRCPTSTRRSR
mgnify:CR=1 FL=1